MSHLPNITKRIPREGDSHYPTSYDATTVTHCRSGIIIMNIIIQFDPEVFKNAFH